ncbi:hypothetical protein ACWHA3_15105 [Streptomyces cyaneofuscatus]|uniref:hypothetical protein n=1 Tax=Streptomyces TaxID=1883 RepID=UPI003869AA74|nr:hypothetical protein OG323_32845 [Streptomyces cyaneofuscatus]
MAAMGAGTALRLARTALFAVVCVAVSGLGHALMSGGPLPLPPLLAVLVPVAAAGWLLARRDRNAPVTVSAHVLGQLGLHAYFTASATGGAHHAHGAMPHASHTGPAGDVSHRMELLSAFDASVFTTGMAASHAVAGLICGWWLWRGEVALARLGRCLALFVRTPLRTAWRLWSATPLDGASPPRPRTRRRPGRCLRDLLALHAISRRGPPLPAPSL